MTDSHIENLAQADIIQQLLYDPHNATPTDLVGFIDLIGGRGIVGWVYDKTRPEASLTITIMIDDQFIQSVPADIHRPDVLGEGHHHPNVGFHIFIPERFHDGSEHQASFFCGNKCLVLTDPKTGRKSHSWPFSLEEALRQVTPADHSIVVRVDNISEIGVTGWAYDEASPLDPTVIGIYVDGEHVRDARCDIIREDVRNSGHPSTMVGFEAPIPLQYFDDISHILEFRSLNGRPMQMVGGESRRAFKFPAITTIGRVDGLHEGALRGWALHYDRRAERKRGGLQILVSLQGHPIAQLLANQFRADVGEAHGCDPNCGFVFVPPPEALAGKTTELRFKVIPGGMELANSPYSVAFPELDTYRKLRELAASADAIFTQFWKLRAQIKSLLPGEQFNLLSYDAWARAYFRDLATLDLPPLPPKCRAQKPPLVSIICPTYRPRIKDFVAAVESIIAQTYTNWELIIVDDYSDCEELVTCIRNFVTRDRRIHAKFNKENSGISVATNTALATAKGRYVAFFDHDDVMVERAMEMMVNAALRTDAKILYCDEDKIDDSGVYSEVNLKPDWNYRLLLSQNYVCHILFVERTHLKKVGPLRPEYDGAQDHDLLLRLAEITCPDEICHVPEILYHWRKTPFSTAASGKTKPYAVAAGARAISDHLERMRLEAQVSSPLGITLYEVVWMLPHEPKVTIIIPYREHISMTRACVQAIRTVTDYSNYEVVLVDNWSTSDEALDFASEVTGQCQTRVVRVEEAFNFSRLNNIAVAATEGEFLLFLNNDVVVYEPNWLKQMVGEALADSRIGIVGNKLLYPNGLVQHGGIILGVGGIGDHAHRGLTANAPGYMSRAVSAQDLSAVTAACMLCRREAFVKVGGFDETGLPVAFNDVDLCLKVRAAGYRILWTPTSVAEHRESLSRGSDFRVECQARFFSEISVMEDRWGQTLTNDPYYNRHFSSRSGIFQDLGHRETVRSDHLVKQTTEGRCSGASTGSAAPCPT